MVDEDEESSSEEEEDVIEDSKIPLPNKPADKETKESEAGEEISALVNYVQPVHFSSFENSESESQNCFIVY